MPVVTAATEPASMVTPGADVFVRHQQNIKPHPKPSSTLA
jgi:hypothetical protein